MYVLINKTNLEVVKTSNSVHHLLEVVEDKYPEDEIIICPVNTWTEQLTVFQEQVLFKKITGSDYVGSPLKHAVSAALITEINKITPDGVDPVIQPEKLLATKKSEARPRAGTVSGLIWDTADSAYAEALKLSSGVNFKSILLALKDGLPDINPATIQVQFGKWRASK